MNLNNYEPYSHINPRNNFISVVHKIDQTPDTSFIRFEERREKLIWAHPGEIYFVKSADHSKACKICLFVVTESREENYE